MTYRQLKWANIKLLSVGLYLINTRDERPRGNVIPPEQVVLDTHLALLRESNLSLASLVREESDAVRTIATEHKGNRPRTRGYHKKGYR